MADLKTQIETTAGSPHSVEIDGEKVVGQKLDDLIKADRYLKASTRAKSKRPMQLFKIKAGGPV